MKNVSKLSILFLIAFLVIGSATNVWAQNPSTTDPDGSSGHLSDTVQEKLAKFEEKMKSISQSKFAKTIGKGIEKAKKAMKWIQEKVKAAKKFINDTKNAVLNSKAYKAAMLAKEIAEEGKKIKALEDKRKSNIAAMKEEIDVEKEALQAKLEAAKENYASGLEIYEEERKETPDEELTTLEQKIEAYKKSSENEIAEIEKQIKDLESSAKKREKEISFAALQEIADEKDKLVELTNRAKELKGGNEKKEEKTPQQEKEETADLFIDKGPVSLKDAAQNKKRRINKVYNSVLKTINTANEKSSKTEEEKEDQKDDAESTGTMDGTSEAMQPQIENLAEQLFQIYDLLEGELKSIQAETYIIMSAMNMNSGYLNTSTVMDMCNYSREGCPGGMGLGGLKNMVEKTVKTAQEKAAEVKGMVDEAQDIAQQAKDAVNDAKDTVNGAKDAASGITGNLSSMGI